MVFVRFSRDKRGYEHVYLIDTAGERGRSRILYWFRTPPGVKVGRSPFDFDTQRALELQNPDVRFDWPQIVASKMPPPAPVEAWREKRRVERAVKRARTEEVAEAPEAVEPLDELRDAAAPDVQLEIKDAEPLTEAMSEGSGEPTADMRNPALAGIEPAGAAAPSPGALGGGAPSPPDRLRQDATETGGPRLSGTGGPDTSRTGRHRRRRRGGRRGRKPGAEAAAAPAVEHGSLDQTNPREESSKEE